MRVVVVRNKTNLFEMRIKFLIFIFKFIKTVIFVKLRKCLYASDVC